MYKHNEMVEIVNEYKALYKNAIITVKTAEYEDIITSVAMFKNDYAGNKYRTYYKGVYEIVVIVA